MGEEAALRVNNAVQQVSQGLGKGVRFEAAPGASPLDSNV